MKKNRVKHIAGKFYKKLGWYSREMALNFDKEAIHKFRVEYKKLRAFFRLLNDISDNNKIKIPAELKKTYFLAGALRDHQLQLERVGNTIEGRHNLLPGYNAKTGFEIAELKSGLLQLLSADPVTCSEKKTINLLPHHLEPQSFPAYLQDKCSAVRQILSGQVLSDTKIHAIRKILKDLVYNLEIYRQADRFPPGTWKEKVVEYFNPLLQEMGNYQDKCTAITLIESYWLKHLHTGEREPLAAVKEKWEEEKASMKQLLMMKLKADQVLATGKTSNIPLSLDIAL